MSFFRTPMPGAKIWELIRVGADTETIAQSLTSDHQADPATARADVETFVAQPAAAASSNRMHPTRLRKRLRR